MTPELTKSQKKIGTIILAFAVVFLYKFYQSENKPEVKIETTKEIKVAPFFTMQKNETGFYTPENYLLDYYDNINKKNWDYLLKHTLNQYNLDFIKGLFEYRKTVGVKIISTENPNKVMAFVTANITYINAASDTITKRVKAQLQLSTDYKTWIVAPLTVY